MPVLIVYGMPDVVDREALNQLAYGLSSVVGVSLEMDSEKVSIFFPADLLQRGLGEELVCLISGLSLSKEPEQTPAIRKNLAEAIKTVLSHFALTNLLNFKKAEVIVNRFDQEIDGFATWEV